MLANSDRSCLHLEERRNSEPQTFAHLLPLTYPASVSPVQKSLTIPLERIESVGSGEASLSLLDPTQAKWADISTRGRSPTQPKEHSEESGLH